MLPLAIVAVSVVFLWWSWDHILAKMLDNLTKIFNKDVGPEKKAVFKRLNELAKKAGPKKLKVLEIGGGTGANFDFVEEGIIWTNIDPTDECSAYYKVKVKDLEDKHVFDGVHKVCIQISSLNKYLNLFFPGSG